ncbi:MAG: hypothetical protein K2H73_03010 [Treponemataceae bacterium]|nr:hypothetical protein [Treponemataceae bacterium]
MPVEEIASWRATAFRRLKKSRPGKERHFAGWGKHVRAGNGILPFEEIALGKQHPFRFLEKSRRGKENLFGWRSLLHWGSTARAGFRQNSVWTTKTFLGAACFRAAYWSR